MAKYHIKYLTMQRILSLFSWHQKNSTSSKEEIIKTCLQKLSQAEEFNEVKLHRHEKLALNKLNQHADIKFPLSGKVKDTKEKVFIMIQIVLGNVPLEDSSTRVQFNTESRVIIQHSHRILKCLVELAAYKENVTILKIAMDLARCMKSKMWNDSPLLLKQLDGIGEQYAKKLADAGVTNFEQLKECEPWKIETACNRYPPFGHNVHETVSTLPSLKLDIERGFSNSPEYQVYVVNICLNNNEKVSIKRNGINLNAAFIAATDDLLIEFRQVPLWKIQQGLKFHFKSNIQTNQLITCSVLPEEFSEYKDFVENQVTESHGVKILGLDIHKTIIPNIQPADVCNNILIAPTEKSQKFEINKTNCVQHHKQQGFIESNELLQIQITTIPLQTSNTKEKQHDSTIKSPKLLPNGRVKCNHACKDKQKRAPKKRKNNIISSPTFSYNKQFTIDEPSPKTRKTQATDTQQIGFELEQQAYQDTVSITRSPGYSYPTLDEEIKSQPATHDEYDLSYQSWLETWDINELDFISKVDLDDDKFSEEMTIEDKKNMAGVETENRSTKNKTYDMLEINLTSDTDLEISCGGKDEMNYKTFTEALGVFDYILQTII
ncbi:5564_t:CDS:10 [Dentiscutata erythropus]|uniref:5564_t:CDS:1 n=1 Tax=Dentiscutata erythropus TaxID=1348616 RepID=A0A9N9GCJ4_9GLOM|nr:5564_t:CDS:10 [Dentiscutata erythropus]